MVGTWAKTVGVLAATLLVTAQLAAAAPPQEPAVSYLVVLRGGATGKDLAKDGFEVKTEWQGLGAVAVRADSRGLARLRAHGQVEFVEEDRPVSIMATGTYTDGAYTWGLQAVHAPQAWSAGYTGQSVKVCILDTGIDYNHPEFIRNGQSIIKNSQNFVADGHPNAQDGNEHGTHVAGTIAGQTSNSGSRIGVAPGVDLYIARVLGDDGTGTTSGVINGLNWCVSQGVKIASLSLGSTSSSRVEQKAFDAAYNSGVLTIAAAGNAGNNRTSYPAGYASVVSVAAVDSSLNHASFSQTNKDVELSGPGVSVLSSVPLGKGARGTATEGTSSYQNNPVAFTGMGSVSGPLVECGLADTTSSCGSVPGGSWIALINRGTITFADKVTNAMAQGAAAAIIVNNDTAAPDDAGSFTLGSAGNWIPTVSVSYNSGVAIRADGLQSGAVAVQSWDYAFFDGTSMATPHASAVAALAWSAQPALKNTQIRSILQSTAADLGARGRDNLYGYGLVRADAAATAAAAMH